MNKKNLAAVGGNTFPVKEQLKARCGAKWDREARVWMVPVDKLAEALAIVGGNRVIQGALHASKAVGGAAIVWSDEQALIVEWFKTGKVNGVVFKNLVVRARAGTGKTFTIIGGIVQAPEAEIAYLVFNAKNRVEAQEKITDPRVSVMTLHQGGFRCIKRVWPKAHVAEDANAVEWDRIHSVCGEIPAEVAAEIFNLVGFCKNIFCGVPSVDDAMALACDKLIECQNYEAPEDGGWTVERLAEVAVEVLQVSLVKDSLNRISFNDMVWLPVAMKWVRPSFDLIVVDEAQDMNAPQLLMARQLARGRIAVVGDDRQAIYEFRGACQDGIDMMKRELNAGEVGLTQTRRCGKSIVAEVVGMVPDYKATDDAHEGLVDEIAGNKLQESAHEGDAILSRVNAPLMPICLSFIRRGIACRIEGRDVGAQLLAIIKKLKGRSIPEVLRKSEAWGARMIARAGKSERSEAKISLILDQVATIAALVEGLSGVGEIEARVPSIFSDSTDRSNQGKQAIVCSTVHKAKGLEWNRVFVLGATFKRSGGQEDNVYYVACTRAKKHLTFVDGRRNVVTQ